MSKAKSKDHSPESKTYQVMLEEVENIVRNMNSSPMDLDEVVSQVERGYKLITQMRERLDATKVKVEKLRADFETQKKDDSKDKPKVKATKHRAEIDEDDSDDDDNTDDDSPF